MKSYQKWICLLMVLVMCMSLTVSVFAAGEEQPAEPETPEYLKENTAEGELGGGKITVTGAIPGEKYDIYQIFYLVSYSTDGATAGADGNISGGKYNYKVNRVWEDFVATAMDDGTPAAKYFNVDSEGYVTWNGLTADKDRAAKFAAAALKYAQDNKIKPVATQNAEKVQAVDENGQPKVDTDGKPIYAEKTTVVFTQDATGNGLKLGYYLVDTSLGALCSLDTTNPEVYMQEKNAVPTNEKSALEGTQWQSNNNAEIGSRVYFKSFITLESGADKLLFHDNMSDGLTLVHDPASEKKDDKITLVLNATNTEKAVKETALVEGTDYTIITKKDATGKFVRLDDGCTFHIEFLDPFFSKLTTGKHNVTITYSAILNENAVVEGDGNTNTSHLDYGNNGQSTPGSKTTTTTWDIPVFKYTLGGTNNTQEIPLSGAVFALSDTAATPVDPIKLVDAGKIKYPVTDAAGNQTGEEEWQCYRVATPEEIAKGEGIIMQITTDNTGKFRILGLDDTTYYLHEITAPTGYKALSKPIAVQVKNDGTLKNNETDNQSVIKVYNGTGSELPSTGGIGTTIFYVVGSVLLVGAAVLLITKKRMSAAEE